MLREQLYRLHLPDSPGVYFFLGRRREVLYIGKATSLRSRVRSYGDTQLAAKRSPIIEMMVAEAVTIDWTVTESVIEALLLEANLIRTHKPRYNSRAKDDKSYNHVVITNEPLPRVLIVRAKDLAEKLKTISARRTFGPFTNGQQFKDALKIIKRLFPYFDTKHPVNLAGNTHLHSRINFNRQIGLYPDPQDQKDYEVTIQHLILFFEGKKRAIIQELTTTMNRLARNEQFEEAALIKKKIFALKHIQDIALIKRESRIHRDDRCTRVEAYDVAHLQGRSHVGVMAVLEGGVQASAEYRKFKIRTLQGANDVAALKEILSRRLGHREWQYPQIIVVDGGMQQLRAAQHTLREWQVSIPVVSVVKDQKHRPSKFLGPTKLINMFKSDILLANAEAHRFAITYHRKDRRTELLKPNAKNNSSTQQ